MIILAGMIGVGKTTYTSLLAKELGTTAFFEPVDNNPILDKYYEDPEKYGFALQIYFLNKRFKAIKKAYDTDNNVLDRSVPSTKMLSLRISIPFKAVSANKNIRFT